MIELEKTYILKNIPFQLGQYPNKEIIDYYMPVDQDHPQLRLRKRWPLLEMTKKTLVKEGDASTQREETIYLSKAEYEALSAIPSKKIRKIRYYVPYEWLILEIDVFQDDLDWLFLMDIEFPDKNTMEIFVMPDFCLADVTQNEMFAWGLLCGKTYASISSLIRQYKGDT